MCFKTALRELDQRGGDANVEWVNRFVHERLGRSGEVLPYVQTLDFSFELLIRVQEATMMKFQLGVEWATGMPVVYVYNLEKIVRTFSARVVGVAIVKAWYWGTYDSQQCN